MPPLHRPAAVRRSPLPAGAPAPRDFRIALPFLPGAKVDGFAPVAAPAIGTIGTPTPGIRVG